MAPLRRRRGRQAFTQEEDERLKRIVMDIGYTNWSRVAELMPKRNARQCRDRWRGYLRPTLVTHQWTEEEDRALLQRYEEFGPRWSVIGRFVSGRSEIALKNRWKLLTNMNQAVTRPDMCPTFVRYVPVPVPYPQIQRMFPKKEYLPLPESKGSPDSSSETSAGEVDPISTAKDLEAFFSTLHIDKLTNGKGGLLRTDG